MGMAFVPSRTHVELVVVVNAYNLNTWKAEAGGS
jgi:hypothetical protein